MSEGVRNPFCGYEYGMNNWTINKGMVRIGTDAISMLEIAERRHGRD